MSTSSKYLAPLGVYGFDDVEPVMLAALVTEDPMLLIGQSGTGKTYLLNTISEALGLEHRHYNASLISFDDLVGFPYPDEAQGGVRFLETPATVWGAESVLIDEISRCKPEHQNRLFALVHERRIQGIALPTLRYRWAAMNPCSGDQSSLDDYAGSEPLDPALADRFALFIEAADWQELSDEARSSIAQPGGEGLCHEFLHVLLRHTEEVGAITPAKHLAFDAVINAIIHRSFGVTWSALMSHYYARVGDLRKLLRPMNKQEQAAWDAKRYKKGNDALPGWVHAWASLYEGRMVADDIAELAESLAASASASAEGTRGTPPFELKGTLPTDIKRALLGDHSSIGQRLDPRLAEALSRAMTEMNGSGIWRSPKGRGVGANPYDALFTAKPSAALTRWRREALAVLKRHLTPDRRSRVFESRVQERLLPVLSTGDRRAFLRAHWSPFLPESVWQIEHRQRSGTTQVYLDVSGSMNAEMPELIALLQRLSRYIRRPFWAFSDEVASATIQNGQLVTRTSGGTSMACVLQHVALTRPEAAIVVTDGYIEDLPRELVKRAAGNRLHVLLTRDGSATKLDRAGIAYTQLDRLPK